MRAPVCRPAQAKRAAFWLLRIALGYLLALSVASCAVVPQNRRRYLVDRTMPAADDPLEKRALRKFHTIREGAAGGDGKPAGGGCGCTN